MSITQLPCGRAMRIFAIALALTTMAAAGLRAGETDIHTRAWLDAAYERVRTALAAPDGIGARTLNDGDAALRAQTVAWKDELLAAASQPEKWAAVEYADRDFRGGIDTIFQSWSADVEAQTALISELKASPMAALREYAAAKERLAALRGIPWDLRFNADDGREISLDDMRGKPVIVAYWSASCKGSRRQISKLVTLYERHHGEGLQIIGINYDSEEEKEESLRFAAENGLVWPHRFDREKRRAEFDEFGLTWVSNLLLFDTEGRLLRSAPGPDLEEWDSLVREQLARAKHR